MKKVFSVLMVASVLSLVACKGNKTEEAAAKNDSAQVEAAPAEAAPASDTPKVEAAPVDSPKTKTAEGEKKAEEHKEEKK